MTTGTEATTTEATQAATQTAATETPEFTATQGAGTPAATPAAPAANEIVTYEYAPTGNAGLDVALNFVGGLGFGSDNAAIVAAQKGDFAPLESALKALGDKSKGYERYIAVAKDAYNGIVEKRKSAESASVAAVEAAVGGKEAWAKIAAFVSEHADEKERAEIDAAFKAGGTQAKAMALHLQRLHQNASGNVKSVVKEDAAAAVPANNSQALSPREFVAEVTKLRQRVGASFESHPEYTALRRRANAYGR